MNKDNFFFAEVYAAFSRDVSRLFSCNFYAWYMIYLIGQNITFGHLHIKSLLQSNPVGMCNNTIRWYLYNWHLHGTGLPIPCTVRITQMGYIRWHLKAVQTVSIHKHHFRGNTNRAKSSIYKFRKGIHIHTNTTDSISRVARMTCTIEGTFSIWTVGIDVTVMT